jgi:multicomponent Na+:H+ antiporter subunit B
MENNKNGMTLFVKTSSRLIVVLGLIFGVHIILRGHLAPGGGFAGGVIIALSFVILILAFGKDAALSKFSLKLAADLESAGSLLFLLIGLAGFLAGTFFLNILAKNKSFKLAMISLESLKVGVGLFVIFLALAILEKSKKEE